MTSRTSLILSAAVIAICAVGAAGYALWPSKHQATATTAARPEPAPSRPDHRSVDAAPTLVRLLPAVWNLDLTSSPMDGLAPSKQAHHHHNVAITRASVPPPLSLELPTGAPGAIDSLGHTAASQGSSAHTKQPTPSDSLVVNLNPHLDDHNAKFADDTHLFNRNNGLRGFMAQNWFNDNFGLQGGLAIKEGRLREEDSDLSDNVAVGMGFLLAF